MFSGYQALHLNIHDNFKSFFALLENKPTAVSHPFHLEFYCKVKNLSRFHSEYKAHGLHILFPYKLDLLKTRISVGLAVQAECLEHF